MNKKKKIFIMVTLSLFALGVLSFGTYALYNIDLLTDNNSISTGQVKMSYTESNEITLNNVVPTSDNKGISSTNYFEFKVNTYIKTNKQMTMNYNIVLEPLNVDSTYIKFNDSDIKVYLTKVDNNTETLVTGPITIDELNQYVLKSQEETFNKNDTERSTTYRLRAWLDYNFDASKINEKTYSYKFRVNVNNEAAPKEDYALTFAKSKVGTDGLEQITHTIDNTLQVDSKFATEYRYRGGNVNNYVTFNNEVWRIIGVIPTEDTNGNIENRIKIVKDESIGNKKWNETQDAATSSYNNWVTGTLNTYLNNDYYNTLTTDAKNMIGTAKYYLGGYNNDPSFTSDVMWQYERKNEANRTGYYYGTNPIIQNDANKKIAIMYASDYGYAASKECTSNLYGYNGSANCITTNNWLDKSANTWLLPQFSDDFILAFIVTSSGFVNYDLVYDVEYAVRPVLSLSSNVKISGGSGTSSDPYQLSL
jgi:hypothetical protein